ncbi:MAG: hypothetical protein GXO36_01940 [Chloroflexi bacterium]|nr:hypothetical protein [Chloroflexota bacterium]
MSVRELFRGRASRFVLAVGLLVVVGLAGCQRNILRATSPRSTASTARPFTLVHLDPPPGSDLPPQGTVLRLTFSQAVDPESLSRGLTLQSDSGPVPYTPAWPQPHTLELHLHDLPPEAGLRLQLGPELRAVDGQRLPREVQAQYRVLPWLRVDQQDPPLTSEDVPLVSELRLRFNLPVVSPAQVGRTVAPIFTLDPPLAGEGRWTDPATFVYSLDAPLPPSTTFTLTLAELTSSLGSRLDPHQPRTWTFHTEPLMVDELTIRPAYLDQPPRDEVYYFDNNLKIRSSQDQANLRASLTPVFTLELNRPWDPDVLRSRLCLKPVDAPPNACAALRWLPQRHRPNVFQFTPEQPLQPDTAYEVRLTWGDLAPQPPFRFVFRTVRPPLRLVVLKHYGADAEVQQGFVPRLIGYLNSSGFVHLTFLYSAALDPEQDFRTKFSLEPEDAVLHVDAEPERGWISVSIENYRPGATYTLTMHGGLRSRWGWSITEPLVLKLTMPRRPLTVAFGITADQRMLLPERERHIPVFVSLVNELGVDLVPVPPQQAVSTWLYLNEAPDQALLAARRTEFLPVSDPIYARFIDFPLVQPPQTLTKGVYWIRAYATRVPLELLDPKELEGSRETPWYRLAIVDTYVAVKQGASELWAWAVDAHTGAPRSNARVSVFDANARLVHQGRTDDAGLFHWAWSEPKSDLDSYLVVVGSPGGEGPFGLGQADWVWTASLWSWTVGWGLGYPDPVGVRWVTDLYPDRPLYRPGDTVHFRLVVRKAFDGRYSLPPELNGQCAVRGYDRVTWREEELVSLEARTDTQGEFVASLRLPKDTRPGEYELVCRLHPLDEEEDNVIASVPITVAYYRKPELDLEVTPLKDGREVEVVTRFYNGARAKHVPFQWTLYAQDASMEWPDWWVGDHWWWEEDRKFYSSFGAEDWMSVDAGQGETDAQGRARVQISWPSSQKPLRFLFQAQARGPEQVPAVGQASFVVHPSAFYLGLKRVFMPRAGTPLSLEVRAFQPDGSGLPNTPVHYRVVQVQLRWYWDVYGSLDKEARYTPLLEGDLTTDAQGSGTIAFTPPQSGLYGVVLESGDVQTRAWFWVWGAQPWGNTPPSSRLDIHLDREEARPGDEVTVFIPNPWPQPAQAWLTLERDTVHRTRIIPVPPGGTQVRIPVTEDDIPNIFVTVVLWGQRPDGRWDMRLGRAMYRVSPEPYHLHVQVWAEPERAQPRDQVTLHVRVTDAQGRPVQGNFTLAVVDQALLDIARDRVPPIVKVFYQPQQLGIKTSSGTRLNPVLYAKPPAWAYLGLGGGGGAEEGPSSLVRHDFRDTALWTLVTTDAQGYARVTLTLPDDLTLWRLWARGLTLDTRIGEGFGHLQSTLPVFIEPDFPAFVRLGDEATLRATVYNTTETPLVAQVDLTVEGLELSTPAQREFRLGPGEHQTLSWRGRPREGVQTLRPEVTVRAGPYADAVQAEPIPVSVPWSARTLGMRGEVPAGEQRTELVYIPEHAQQGQVQLTLASSPLALAQASLDVLSTYPYLCTEQLATRLVANALVLQWPYASEAQRAQAQSRLRETWDLLRARQLEDGGWTWWPGGGRPDPFITAYVIWALDQARPTHALPADETDRAIKRALAWLTTEGLEALDELECPPTQTAFIARVLAQHGHMVPVHTLWPRLVARMDTPVGWALLASLAYDAPGLQPVPDAWAQVRALAERDLDGRLLWSCEPNGGWWASPAACTGGVVYWLGKYPSDAQSLLAPALEGLLRLRHPDGTWGSTFSTVWAVLGLFSGSKALGPIDATTKFEVAWDGQRWQYGTLTKAEQGMARLSRLDAPGLHEVTMRNHGEGRLLYNLWVRWRMPVEAMEPIQRGLLLTRTYTSTSCEQAPCPALETATARVGELTEVRLTLHVFHPTSYVVVEDAVPAGAVALNPVLKHEAARLEMAGATERSSWWFGAPVVYPDRVVWAAEYLPSGTYTLVYYLDWRYRGVYQTPPARAWAFYQPTLQATTEGLVWRVAERAP